MEIEIKAKVKNFKSIKQKLIQMGAKRVKKVHQIDEYYSLYKRPLRKIKGGDIVRIRYNKNDRAGRFEYHSSKSQFASEEYEVVVGDILMLKRIMNKMKARLEAVVDKQREYYQKGRFEIVLDSVKELGRYVEVEIQGKDTLYNRQLIVKFLNKLGIDKKQFCPGQRYGAMISKKRGKKYMYF